MSLAQLVSKSKSSKLMASCEKFGQFLPLHIGYKAVCSRMASYAPIQEVKQRKALSRRHPEGPADDAGGWGWQWCLCLRGHYKGPAVILYPSSGIACLS